MSQVCDVCGLRIYPSKAAALGALRRLPRHRRRKPRGAGGQLHVFQGRACGNWHHGRQVQRSLVAWKARP